MASVSSPEFQAVAECAEELEAAFLQRIDEDFVRILHQDGFLAERFYKRLINNNSSARAERASQLLNWIKDEIKQEKSFFIVLTFRLRKVELYAQVVEKLDSACYQRIVHCMSSPKKASPPKGESCLRGSVQSQSLINCSADNGALTCEQEINFTGKYVTS